MQSWSFSCDTTDTLGISPEFLGRSTRCSTMSAHQWWNWRREYPCRSVFGQLLFYHFQHWTSDKGSLLKWMIPELHWCTLWHRLGPCYTITKWNRPEGITPLVNPYRFVSDILALEGNKTICKNTLWINTYVRFVNLIQLVCMQFQCYCIKAYKIPGAMWTK